MTQDIEIPQWDPALEGLITEEVERQGSGLTLDDIIRLAKEYSIRFDDIMVTVFELCFHGKWQYQDENGNIEVLNRDDINKLFVNRRIKEEDMQHFFGSWNPVA